jgi:hypothetical protein
MKPRIWKTRNGMWECGMSRTDMRRWRDVTPFAAWAGWKFGEIVSPKPSVTHGCAHLSPQLRSIVWN